MTFRYWFHGTSEENAREILKKGFNSDKGTWGEGIYFSSTLEGARTFGDTLLKVLIEENEILRIDYKDIEERFPNEEQYSEVRDWAYKCMGFLAIAICYTNGETELCVYDSSLIKEIKMYH